jgi:hypothetical protein
VLHPFFDTRVALLDILPVGAMQANRRVGTITTATIEATETIATTVTIEAIEAMEATETIATTVTIEATKAIEKNDSPGRPRARTRMR